MRKTTLGEYGQKLPIGVRTDRQFNKDFSLRTYKSVVDRHLGDWDEANEGKFASAAAKLAGRIPKFLSLICEDYGGIALPPDPEGNSTPEQELRFYQAYYADVMYAYVYARLVLDHRMEIPFTCQNKSCKHRQRGIFDLRSLEVDVMEEGDEIERWIKLKEPFKTRDGKQVTKVCIQPILWSSMLQPGVFSGLMSQVSYSALKGCIAGVDCMEGNYQLTDAELDQVSRIDVVTINRLAGTMAAGIDLETDVECAKCGHVHVDALNWTFDDFFGSSLPISETAIS
jgi:hypothetical protein